VTGCIDPMDEGTAAIAYLRQRGAAEMDHSGASLLDHLLGTTALLHAWRARPSVVRAGLFHSVYGTPGFDGALASADDRDTIRELIGRDAEELVWLFSSLHTQRLVDAVQARTDVVERRDGAPINLTPTQRADLCEMTVANWLEQRPRLPTPVQIDFLRAAGVMADEISEHARASVALAFEVLRADFACRKHFRNNHRVVRITLDGDHGGSLTESFEPETVAALPGGIEAIIELGDRLRDAGYDNSDDCGVLGQLALAYPVTEAAARSVLGHEVYDRLRACDFLVRTTRPEHVQASNGVLALDDLLVSLPRESRRPDLVYVGYEATLLDHVRAALVPAPQLAVDLGAGAGLTGVLVGRHAERVVLTDVAPRAVAGARLTWALNDARFRRRTSIVRADAAQGLRSRTVNLLTANAPYIPSPYLSAPNERSPDAWSKPVSFADGGPTGSELPVRFLHEGAELLAEGGVLALLTLDTTLVDGRRPIRDALADLESKGFTTIVLETPYRLSNPTYTARLLRDITSWSHVAHVAAIVMHRGGSHAGRREHLDNALRSLAGLGWR